MVCVIKDLSIHESLSEDAQGQSINYLLLLSSYTPTQHRSPGEHHDERIPRSLHPRARRQRPQKNEQRVCIYDLGFSFFSFHNADRPTPETFTTLNLTPGISPLALPLRPKPARRTSSFSSTKLRQPSLGTVGNSLALSVRNTISPHQLMSFL